VGFEIVDGYAKWLVGYKAKQLVGKAGFTESDKEDIEQELILDLLERSSNYDPDKSRRHTFVAWVVENGVARLLERRQAAKRDQQRIEFSLNETMRDEEGGETERSATIPDPRGETARLCDLVLDVGELLQALPPKLRSLCEGLKVQTVSEISQQTGIPRSTLYESIYKLRRQCRSKGIDEYV